MTDVRERILHRFEVWLDDTLECEPPVEGIAAEILEQLQSDSEADVPEAGCDLYSLWSAVIAATEETKLQGRAFKQLHDGLVPMQELVGSVDAMLRRYEASLDLQEQRAQKNARHAVLGDILAILIDLRDRLVRGADSARGWLEQASTHQQKGPSGRLWRRVFPGPAAVRTQHAEAVRSLLTGYNLCREVLDEALGRLGVRPMDCLGRPFDPHTMNAVDIQYDSDAPDGTVAAVYRQGYWWDEAVYRPAEVQVVRNQPQGPPRETDDGPNQGGQHESQ